MDVSNFELKLFQIDPFIQKLRKIYKVNPEWFEIPKPKLVKGKNEVNHSIKVT